MECAMVKLNSLSLPHGGNKIQYPMFFKNFNTNKIGGCLPSKDNKADMPND